MPCLHPIKIKNRYGEYMDVPCGRCYGCLNKKRLNLSTMTKLESKKHRYSMFVTLTYAPEYLPTCTMSSVKRKDGSHELRVRYTSPRMIKYYGTDFCANISVAPNRHYVLKDMLKPFINRALHVKKRGEFGVLWKRDVVNFMKRLRYYINQYNLQNERKITTSRYVFVGEYGTKYFRPHYHAVLFYDDPEIATRLSTFVAKAWKYGRFDVQLSRDGDCCKYVSSYVTSYGHCPAIFRFPWSRPFALHSSHFGQSPDEDAYKDLQSLDYGTVSRRVYDVDGKLKEIAPSVSLQSALYPKCYGYSVSADNINLVRYKLLQILEREARETYGIVCGNAMDVWRFFISRFNLWTEKLPVGLSLSELFKGAKNLELALANALYVSQKVFRLCDKYSVSVDTYYYSVIKPYYEDKSYHLLVDGLTRMEDDTRNGLSAEHLIHRYMNLPPCELGDYFHNADCFFRYFVVLSHFAESVGLDPWSAAVMYCDYTLDPLYETTYMEQSRYYNDCMKHKKQNEINRFMYNSKTEF